MGLVCTRHLGNPPSFASMLRHPSSSMSLLPTVAQATVVFYTRVQVRVAVAPGERVICGTGCLRCKLGVRVSEC